MTEDLNRVKAIILDCVKSITNTQLIESINKYILSNHGKMLRPKLLLLFSKIFNNKINKNSLILAAIIELIHIATLVHDDVLDNTNIRRNKRSINAVWGNQLAVLGGNFLYSRALKLTEQLQLNDSNKLAIFNSIIDSANIIIEGEILQLSHKYNFNITEQEYLKIMNYKTAELFIMTVKFANISQDNVANIDLLDFGLNFGIAYQLLNDIEDYYKSGNDIKDGKITLPLIMALNNLKLLDLKLKNKLINLIKNYKNLDINRLLLIKNIIYNYGGFEYTINLVQKYLDTAKNFILTLEESKYKQDVLAIIMNIYI